MRKNIYFKNSLVSAINAFAIIFLGLLMGCATPVERLYNTPSGNAEITINADKQIVIDHFLSNYLSRNNWNLVSQTSNSLIFETDALSTSEDIYISMALGNSYSSNSRQSHINFISVANGTSTKVFFKRVYIAQMPLGQINKKTIELSNAQFNAVMENLTKMKFEIESKLNL